MLAVVLFHAEVPGLGGGFVGVDVFFVISGFLITGLLWREVSTAGTVRLRRFYGARARRLLPASAAVGVVTVIGAAVLLPPLQARTVIGDGIASALYVGNYRFILQGVDYFAPYVPPSPFLHYWSLGVEEQFYLVWPALIIGTAWLDPACASAHQDRGHRRRDARIWWCLRWSRPCRSRCRWWSLTGCLRGVLFAAHPGLAVGPRRPGGPHGRPVAPTAATSCRDRGMGRAGADPAGLHLLGTTTHYPGTAALLPVLGTALVIGAGCAAPSQGCGRVLALSPMRAIGRMSYSWYLWHWPVLLLAPPLLGHPLGLAGRLAAVARLRRAGGAHTASHREPVAIRRSRAQLCPGAVSRSAVPPPRSRSVWAWRCWCWCPSRSGRGAPAAPLTVTAAPAPAGSRH